MVVEDGKWNFVLPFTLSESKTNNYSFFFLK